MSLRFDGKGICKLSSPNEDFAPAALFFDSTGNVTLGARANEEIFQLVARTSNEIAAQ